MKQGDFILIDFVGRIAGTGEIFDLTDRGIAEKEGILNPKQKYEPALVVMGAKMVIPGVEKQLEQMNPGDEKEFTVKMEDAFGPRNPRAIKIIPMASFLRQKINPVPGIFVNIGGRQAKVQSVSGGRVRTDFNHPLAGKELHYKLRATKQITTAKGKADSLLGYYGIKCTTSLKEGTLTIKTEKHVEEVARKFLETPIRKWIKTVKKIKFEPDKPPKKPEEPPKEAEAQAGP